MITSNHIIFRTIVLFILSLLVQYYLNLYIISIVRRMCTGLLSFGVSRRLQQQERCHECAHRQGRHRLLRRDETLVALINIGNSGPNVHGNNVITITTGICKDGSIAIEGSSTMALTWYVHTARSNYVQWRK